MNYGSPIAKDERDDHTITDLKKIVAHWTLNARDAGALGKHHDKALWNACAGVIEGVIKRASPMSTEPTESYKEKRS